ncbi:hypothetical protein OG937_03380 [Streptomyces sp. NBC_00510]
MRGNAEVDEQRTPSQPPHALDVWSGAPLFVTDGVDDQHLARQPVPRFSGSLTAALG